MFLANSKLHKYLDSPAPKQISIATKPHQMNTMAVIITSSTDGLGHLRAVSWPTLTWNFGVGAVSLCLRSSMLNLVDPTPVSPSPRRALMKGGSRKTTMASELSRADGDSVSGTSQQQSPGTPRHTSSSQETQNDLQIVVPKTPSLARSEYRTYPELDAVIMRGDDAIPRKRKRDEVQTTKLRESVPIDREEEVQTAVQGLRGLMHRLFEAEDNLEQALSDDSPHNAQRMLEPVELAEGTQHMVASDVQAKLDSAITKAISASALQKVDVEDLTRLQKLCHRSVMISTSLEVAVPDGSEKGTTQDWLQRLELRENGLRSSRIILKIATAGWHEKQLCPEEILLDILKDLKQFLDSCIIPITESRADSACHELLKSRPGVANLLGATMQRLCRLLKLLAVFIVKVDLSESSSNTIEAMMAGLVFVENATTDKDAVLGVQKYEALRRQAMDILARIFLRYPTQRSSILREILASLEKLPVTRQSARQFRTVEGKPIQLVSALLMQLIQTCTSKARRRQQRNLDASEATHAPLESESESSSIVEPSPKKARFRPDVDAAGQDSSLERLKRNVQPLLESALSSANFVIHFLVQRALTSTKTGDQPYRNLLDIFTEDFVSLLGSSDWPAAEMLLTSLLSNLISILQSEKSSAPAKTMALDLMGVMGSGIADLRNFVDRSSKSLEVGDGHVADNLARRCQEVLEGEPVDLEILALGGPYRSVIEYLQYRGTDDLQLQSARDLYLAQWAKNTLGISDTIPDPASSMGEHRRLVEWLNSAFEDPDFLEAEGYVYVKCELYARR